MFGHEIQIFGWVPNSIFPSNRANHDWGSLSGAKDDTHKSQHRSVPVSLQAFLLGKQARSSQDSKRNDIDNPSNKHADDTNDIADEYIRV